MASYQAPLLPSDACIKDHGTANIQIAMLVALGNWASAAWDNATGAAASAQSTITLRVPKMRTCLRLSLRHLQRLPRLHLESETAPVT